MKKVSVIIPLYNAERWITEGILPDVYRQTYQEMQVIIINDGSKDNTREILNRRIEKERENSATEYLIIHQENAGIAVTRNRALQQATGEYVMFLDQDDHIPEDYVEHFVMAIEKGDLDIVIGGYRTVDEDGNLIQEFRFDDNDKWSKFKFITPWGRIYRRSFIEDNKLQFLDYPIGEDIYFNLCAYAKTERLLFINYTGYSWVQNTLSFSHTVQRCTEKTDLRPLFQAILDYVGSKEKLESGYEYFFIKTIVYQILTTSRKEKYKIIRDNWEKLFGWLKMNYTDYTKQLSKIEPKGEEKHIRRIVRLIVWLEKTRLYPLFLCVYRLL